MQLEPERLIKILEVLQELPAPNYRCVGLHPLYSRDTAPSHLARLSHPCLDYFLGDSFLGFCRTLEFLMRHLVHMASFSAQTNMHARNLAIVWAPNLLRWVHADQCVAAERLTLILKDIPKWMWLCGYTGEGVGIVSTQQDRMVQQ